MANYIAIVENVKEKHKEFGYKLKGREIMKKLKKLTLRQRQVLVNAGYDCMGWYLERQNDKDHTFTYVNKDSKEVIVLSYK